MRSKEDFLASLLGNVARARVLRVVMMNPTETFSLPVLAKRAGATPLNTRKEAKALEKLGILKSATVRNGKKTDPAWHVNPSFRHAQALTSFVHEVSPAEHAEILHVLKRAGAPSLVLLSGLFVGDENRPADLIVASMNPNESRIDHAIRSLESLYGREIRYASFSLPEFRYRLTVQDRLIRDTLDFPHIVLLDRSNLL